LLLFPILAALGLAQIASWLIRNHGAKRFVIPVSAVVLATAAAPSLWTWRGITASGVEHINGVHIVMARWVRDDVAPGIPVAAFDIGAMAYFCGHPVVDLGGLVDSSYLPYLLGGRVPQYLEERRIQLVVLPSPYESGDGPDLGRGLGIVGNRRLTLRPLAEAGSPPDVWWRGFAATSHASPRLVAYQILWPP
jgi:hypothetical protein